MSRDQNFNDLVFFTWMIHESKLAADARHRACRCGPSPQMACNDADAARLARLEGKECRHKDKRSCGDES